MNLKLLSASAMLLALWFSFSSSKLDPNNPPTKKTGAPGETTCGDSGCHSPAGTLTGTVAMSGIPDTVTPGQTYNVTLTNESNATKAGFEMTCLDGANAACGTFTAPANSGVSIGTSGGKQYPRQATPKTLANGSTSWTFTWKAPTTASGNKCTFYFASLCANGNGQRSGDKVLLGNKTITLNSTTATSQPADESAVSLFPTLAHSEINIVLNDASKGQVNIVNMKGATVKQSALSANNLIDISHLQAGTYIARIEVNGKVAVKKFIVE